MKNFFSNPALLAKFLFILLAALWVGMAFMSFGRVSGGDLEHTIRYATNSLFMLIGGVMALFFAFRLGAKSKRIYQFALAFVILDVILTVLGKIGVVEVVFIILNVFTLYVLYVYSDEFTEYTG